MSRKRSKKALKNRIKQLEFTISNLKSMNLVLQSMNQALRDSEKRIKERFRELGSLPEVKEFGGLQVVTARIKPQAWGVQMEYVPGHLDSEWAKKELTMQIVESLIENDFIQIIRPNYYEPFKRNPFREDEGLELIGAKLYVVPWEQATMKSIELKKLVEKKMEGI